VEYNPLSPFSIAYITQMYKYKSKCRWSILLYVDGDIVEIRPGELFESEEFISIKHLEEVKPKPSSKKQKRSKRCQ
jgi:hypothetical protein